MAARDAQESLRGSRRPENEARSDPREAKRLSKGVKERPKDPQELEKLVFMISIPLCSGIGGSSTPGPPGTSTLGPWTSKKQEKDVKKHNQETKNAQTSPTESHLRQKSEPESQKERKRAKRPKKSVSCRRNEGQCHRLPRLCIKSKPPRSFGG